MSAAILILPQIALIICPALGPATDGRALFVAGVVPGQLVGLAIAAPVLPLCRWHGLGEVEARVVQPAFWLSLGRTAPGLLAPVIILGGLRSGLFTPTETAVVAVF